MNNSNYTINKRCPDTVGGSNCIEWLGDDIECLGICKYQSLTVTQTAIANKICELITLTEVDEIVLPACFKGAFDTDDATIHDFLTFILDKLCEQHTEIDKINTRLTTIGDEPDGINPLIELDYKCCSDNSCVTTGTVTLSVALQNILTCICGINDLLGDLPTGYETFVSYVQSLKTLIDTQNTTISTITTSYKNKINAILTAAGTGGSNATLAELTLSMNAIKNLGQL